MLYAILLLVALLYIYVDVNYFIRVLFTYVFSVYGQRKLKVSEPATFYGICLPSDLNVMLAHMNNARYLRELDIALINFFVRNGILPHLMTEKKAMVQNGTTIRFRRSIPLFATYSILTKIVTWDQNSIYVQQKVINSKNFVCAVSYSKQTIIDFDVIEFMSKKHNQTKPFPCPDDLQTWIKFLAQSSDALKKH